MVLIKILGPILVVLGLILVGISFYRATPFEKGVNRTSAPRRRQSKAYLWLGVLIMFFGGLMVIYLYSQEPPSERMLMMTSGHMR